MQDNHNLIYRGKVWKVAQIVKIDGYEYQNVGFGYVFNIQKQKQIKWRELKND